MGEMMMVSFMIMMMVSSMGRYPKGILAILPKWTTWEIIEKA